MPGTNTSMSRKLNVIQDCSQSKYFNKFVLKDDVVNISRTQIPHDGKGQSICALISNDLNYLINIVHFYVYKWTELIARIYMAGL